MKIWEIRVLIEYNDLRFEKKKGSLYSKLNNINKLYNLQHEELFLCRISIELAKYLSALNIE